MKRGSVDPRKAFVRIQGGGEGLLWLAWLAFIAWWVVELELGPFELVLLGVALEASSLLAETPTGVVADMYSRRLSVVISYAMMGAAALMALISAELWVMMLAQVILGVGWTFRSGADVAWLTDEMRGRGDFDDDEIESLMLKRHRFGLVTGILATIPGTFLMLETSARTVVVIVGLLNLMLAAAAWFSMAEDHFEPGTERSATFGSTLRQGLAAVSGVKRLRVLVIVALLVALGAEAFDRIGFKHLVDNAGADDSSIVVLAALFLMLSLAGLVVNALVSRALSRGYGVARAAVALLLIATVGAIVASMTNVVFGIAAGYMLQDSARESLFVVFEGWANRDAPNEVRATVHSLIGQVGAIGQLVGGMALGVVAEMYSIPVVLFTAGMLFGLAGLAGTRGIARG